MARYLAITGGVGGAKLALGLSKVLPSDEIIFIVNTADDFQYSGLHISPDIDTLTYTLGGLSNPDTGWGRKNETWNVLGTLASMQGETWFKLGDSDLALHLKRTQLLAEGFTLTEATAQICTALKIPHRVLPVSDDPIKTVLQTKSGALSFQDYFVKYSFEPEIESIRFDGANEATLNPLIADQLKKSSAIEGIIICPSNPYVSIDPILSIPNMRENLRKIGVPIIAVSPIVDGHALKGPTAKMMAELGMTPSAATVAMHYEDFLTGFILDKKDGGLKETINTETVVTNTIMLTLEDKIALAREIVNLLKRVK